MKIFIVFIMLVNIYASDYSKLQKHKDMFSSSNSKADIEAFSVIEKKTNKFIVRFKNINTFSFESFEELYQVELHVCIAHGICVFENNSSLELDNLINHIKFERNDLKSIKKYEKYKMKTF